MGLYLSRPRRRNCHGHWEFRCERTQQFAEEASPAEGIRESQKVTYVDSITSKASHDHPGSSLLRPVIRPVREGSSRGTQQGNLDTAVKVRTYRVTRDETVKGLAKEAVG